MRRKEMGDLDELRVKGPFHAVHVFLQIQVNELEHEIELPFAVDHIAQSTAARDS